MWRAQPKNPRGSDNATLQAKVSFLPSVPGSNYFCSQKYNVGIEKLSHYGNEQSAMPRYLMRDAPLNNYSCHVHMEGGNYP